MGKSRAILNKILANTDFSFTVADNKVYLNRNDGTATFYPSEKVLLRELHKINPDLFSPSDRIFIESFKEEIINIPESIMDSRRRECHQEMLEVIGEICEHHDYEVYEDVEINCEGEESLTFDNLYDCLDYWLDVATNDNKKSLSSGNGLEWAESFINRCVKLMEEYNLVSE